uniref:Apple domain-containing protein n=1 Tax=Vitrella brassicaformis TaxID=1169539 RepID=A0A7S1P3E2_9ALVE
MIDAPLVCQELCQASVNCNGFVYVGETEEQTTSSDAAESGLRDSIEEGRAYACYLKRARHQKTKTEGIDAQGYVTGPKACGGYDVDVEYTGESLPGTPIAHISSHLACQSLCQSHPTCRYWSHYTNKASTDRLTCWLKKAKYADNESLPVHKRGVVSGRRYT